MPENRAARAIVPDMTNRRWCVLLAGVVVMLSLAEGAAAATATPTDTLRSFFAQADKIVRSPDPDFVLEARRHIIRTLAYEVFDFRGAAALALGPEWKARTPAERDEFTRLFAYLLETGYVSTMGSRATMKDGLGIDYVGETIEGDAATVRTLVLGRNGNDLTVDYRMVRADGRWAVRDVIIDGLSLAANYRAQFQRVIQTSSYAELLTRMRAMAPDAQPIPMTSKLVETPEPVVGDSSPTAILEDARAAATTPVEPRASSATGDTSIAAAPAAASTDGAREVAVSSTAPAVSSVAAGSATAPGRTSTALLTAAAAPPAPVAPTPRATPAPVAARAATPVAAPTPATDIARATPAPRFWVQVGAFRDDRAVIALMQRLRQHAVTLFNATETTATGKLEPVARVLVGPFSQWADAAAKVRELQASGLRPFIAEVRE
jgi:phospholipid transport system substrate-binding protein